MRAFFSFIFSKFTSIGDTLASVVGVVAVAAVGFSFQHVSWRNTAIMQEANELVERATRSYENAAAILGKRHQASYRFSQDLFNKIDERSPVVTASMEERELRFASPFREANRAWSEQYDQVLGEIDYFLDRSLGIEAIVRSRQLGKFNCAEPLVRELKNLQLDHRSLKLHFAVLDHCFRQFRSMAEKLEVVVRELSGQTENSNSRAEIEKRVIVLRDNKLSDIHTHANIFRCFARKRVDFLRTVRTTLIERPFWQDIGRAFYDFGPAERNVFVRYAHNDAIAHFKEAERACGAL